MDSKLKIKFKMKINKNKTKVIVLKQMVARPSKQKNKMKKNKRGKKIQILKQSDNTGWKKQKRSIFSRNKTGKASFSTKRIRIKSLRRLESETEIS